MIRTLRITLPGLKGFCRVYKVNSSISLYKFHKTIQSDLEFPVDQPILFKSMDLIDNVVARYALIDLGFGTVDNVTLDDAIKAGVAIFHYYYDVKGKKYVIIAIEPDEEKGFVDAPTIVETKGPIPLEFEKGYVAFEDLPKEHRHLPSDDGEDDFEDDAPEDEDKDNDSEEIYDENEE